MWTVAVGQKFTLIKESWKILLEISEESQPWGSQLMEVTSSLHVLLSALVGSYLSSCRLSCRYLHVLQMSCISEFSVCINQFAHMTAESVCASGSCLLRIYFITVNVFRNVC